MEVIWTFPPVPASAGGARRFVGRTLSEWGHEELVDAAGLVASELVTNVVLHARTRAVVTLAITENRFRLRVIDHAPITARVGELGDDDNGRGNGLVIVKEISDDWGVDAGPERKTVWAEWRLDRERVGAVSES